MTHVPSSVVIIGGGVGGVGTAAALRAGGFAGELTLVEAAEVPYDRPPLSKAYLAGEQDLADIALQPPDWYDDQGVRLVTGETVTALRPDERLVELSTGRTLAADTLVLATGGHAARPPLPGVDSPLVHVLRDHDEADRLRSALVLGARLLVVGGGLIGAEAASTAAELGVEVTLIDPAPIPLELAVGAEVGAWLHARHAEHGISTKQAALVSIEDKGTVVLATIQDDPEPLEFDAVLLGVGMRPETTLAETIGLEVDRGIIVDAEQRTSHPWVLAVGDATRRRSNGVLRPRAEHWEAAQHDGQRAAATLLGTAQPTPTAPWFWTDRHGLHIESVGHMNEATDRVLRGTPGDGPFSAWGLRDGTVVAAVSVDDPNAVRAARRMIDRGVTVSATALADVSTDLKHLLRTSR
ncbi:NAD(P)/FAD-dependent oxidoreductase [Nocardia miyunensis]|uniref:NAD(P)/FAD-dependent oxidoreductase n=1 Tax=Nocardia miyunensis TaxID=282684 RepID=UPI000836B5EE|nr:FAD-dependent oxidoreductase [Nocardia miyunensis]